MNEKEDGSLTNLTFCTNSTDTTILTTSNLISAQLGPAESSEKKCETYLRGTASGKNVNLEKNSKQMPTTNINTDGNLFWGLDSSFDEASLANTSKNLTQSSTNTQLTNVSELRSNLFKCQEEVGPLLLVSHSNNENVLNIDERPTKSIKDNDENSRLKNFFADIRCFTFFMCLIVMMTNALTVGYRNSVITTIEKRFEFSSVFSGVLSGCLELGSLITTLFVSYFCAKSHIPRCVAVSSLCCVVGSLLYALPHFLSGSYTLNNKVMNKSMDELLCKPLSSAYNSSHYVEDTSLQLNAQPQKAANGDTVISFLKKFDIIDPKCLLKPSNMGHFTVLILANILIGSSSAPLYTLGTTYIDNHVTKDDSSIYLACVYSMLAFGPVVGYLIGAFLLQYYVDGFSYSIKELNINPGDSNWVGAWYMGFIIFGVLIFFTAFPFFCFPKVIRKNRIQVENEEKFRDDVSRVNEKIDESTFGNLKTLPFAIKNILVNKVFMIVTFAFCFEITIISGFITFLPKYIEHQFSVNDSMANIYTGGVAIPGACVGIVGGGFIVKKFKIDIKGASLMAICCNILCLIGIGFLIFLGCPNIKMAGTTMHYTTNENLVLNVGKLHSNAFNLTSSCNSNCQCSPSNVEPICANGITYFSPCYAGCKEHKLNNSSRGSINQEKAKHFYTSCSCIEKSLKSDESSPSFQQSSIAYSGACSFHCKTLGPFLIVLFLITLFTTLNQMPMLMVTLRSVTKIERPFALGLQLVIMRLLAYMPSPLIFGKAIEWTCLVWRRDECNQVGSCLFYDREHFRQIYGAIAALYKSLSFILFIYLFISMGKSSYKEEKSNEISDKIHNSVNSLNLAHSETTKKIKQESKNNDIQNSIDI